MAVARDPRRTRVDHVLDAGHGQRGLGHVGGQDDPAVRVRLEDAVLLGVREPRVQRQDLDRARSAALVGELVVQRVRSVADLPLTAQEDQYVAGRLDGEFVDGVQDRLGLVAVDRARVVRVVDRAVAHLDRIGPAGDLDDRRRRALAVREVLGEPLGVDGRRGDDHLEVGAAGEEPLEVTEDEVDVQAALVRLVDDERVVAGQVAIALQLVEQDAVGHQLDQRTVADLVGEPDREADRLAQLGAELLRDPLRHRPRREPPRLRVPDHALHTAAELETDLRNLRRLPGPGLTRDHHDLVIPDRRRDLVLQLTDRQLRRIRDLRHGRPPYLDPPLGLLDRADHTLERLGPLPRVLGRPHPLEPPPELLPVVGGQPIEPSHHLSQRQPVLSGRVVGGLGRRRAAPGLRTTPATRPTTYGGVLDGTGGWGRTRRLGPGIRHNPSSLGGRAQPLTRITKGALPAP